jgi:hypothetical protein
VTIAVGTPSLVNGQVRVPIITSGYAAPYSGLNVHLRWDSAIFKLVPSAIKDSPLATPFCLDPVPDTDGGGASYACGATGGLTTTTGVLATIVLAPAAASGCSSLHLFTYGAPDGGDFSTGTFLVDAGSNVPEPAHYIDGSASVSGKTC